MSSSERTLPEIIELTSAYYGSAVLFAALELNIFSLLAHSGCGGGVAEIATLSGADARGLRLLMDACVAVGLLRKEGECYHNTAAGAVALVSGAQHDLTRAIAYNRDVYPAWGKLADLVRTGHPVEAPEEHLGADAERTRRFVMAMHGRALGIGRMVVPFLQVPPNARVLDLAGGPGTYAVLLAQANVGVSCLTLDLPAVSAVAAELVAAAGMSARVECSPGDYHTATFTPESFDVVTIFGALHQESPAMILSILRRAWQALKAGGLIYILDMMTDATRTSPPFSALFAVNMALTTHNGWVFSDRELHEWLQEVGFVECHTQPLPPPMPHWLTVGKK